MRKVITYYLIVAALFSFNPSYGEDWWCALDLNNSGEIDAEGEASQCEIGLNNDALCEYGLKSCVTTKICPIGFGFSCNANEQCIASNECGLKSSKTVYQCADDGNDANYGSLGSCEADCSTACSAGSVAISPPLNYCGKTDSYFNSASECTSACAEIESCVDKHTCPYGESNQCVPNSIGQQVCTLLPCIDRNDPVHAENLITDTQVPNSTGDYDSAGACIDELRLFSGKKSRCKLKGTQTAWKNCCKSDGKVYQDSQGRPSEVIQSTLASATMKGIAQGIRAAYTTYQATGSLASASDAISSVWQGAFDPYSLAISFAINIVMNYLLKQCKPESQFTALSKDSGTCHYVGKTCIEKWLFFGCVQKANFYCCFNTKMGRILQEQGRLQLGKGWGTPSNPLCEGFTPEEFQSLDFSRIDLSEYYSDLKPKNINAIRNDAIQQLESKGF